MRGSLLACVAVLLAVPAVAPAQPAGPRLDRAFWLSIRDHDLAVPEGRRAVDLLLALDPVLASPDPALRDDVGYGVAARWIYRQRLLSPDELRQVANHWMENLRVGLGETGNDGVLLRSFSALDLSIVAAFDLEAPFMRQAEVAALFEAALAYFAGERDVRGYEPGKGWMHSVAHTSDLLKFLARSDRLPAGGQERLLGAVAAKLDAVAGPLVWDEDRRVAAVLVSVVRRKDFDGAAFARWLESFPVKVKAVWAAPALDPARFHAVENARHVLLALHAALAQVKDPAPALADARARVLATLADMP